MESSTREPSLMRNHSEVLLISEPKGVSALMFCKSNDSFTQTSKRYLKLWVNLEWKSCRRFRSDPAGDPGPVVVMWGRNLILFSLECLRMCESAEGSAVISGASRVRSRLISAFWKTLSPFSFTLCLRLDFLPYCFRSRTCTPLESRRTFLIF